MKRILTTIIVGLLFGAGLVVSDMINPARVRAFLDVTGDWDPSLAFVMIGALIPSALAWVIRRRMDKPLLEDAFRVPEGGRIDGRLIAGAAVFGVGWGLVGFCPGPAVAALTTELWPAFVFTLAMVGGMALFRLAFER